MRCIRPVRPLPANSLSMPLLSSARIAGSWRSRFRIGTMRACILSRAADIRAGVRSPKSSKIGCTEIPLESVQISLGILRIRAKSPGYGNRWRLLKNYFRGRNGRHLDEAASISVNKKPTICSKTNKTFRRIPNGRWPARVFQQPRCFSVH